MQKCYVCDVPIFGEARSVKVADSGPALLPYSDMARWATTCLECFNGWAGGPEAFRDHVRAEYIKRRQCQTS